MRARALILAVLALVASPLAAEEPELLRLPLPDTLRHQDEWYGIYLRGTKSGYAHTWTRRIGEGEGSRLVYASDVHLEVQAMGQRVVTTLSERSYFEGQAPYALLSALWRQTDPENQQTIRVDATGPRLKGVIEEAGTTRTIERDRIDYTFADFWTPLTWLQAGPRVGDALRVRSFDVSSVETDEDQLDVLGVRKTVAGGVEVVLYDLAVSSKREGDEGTAVADALGRVLSMQFAELFELRYESEETAKKLEIGGDLFLLDTVAIDKPIGQAPKIRRLVVEVEGDSDLQDGPRQTVVRDEAGGRVTLSLGAAHGHRVVATPEEIERGLERSVEYPIRHPGVKALAARAVGDAATPREKVERLVTFVGEYVVDAVLPNATTVMRLLDEPRGDCSEHALLFTALARSLGIPTREVSGLMYMGDEYKRFGGHAWNEVVLDGHWVQVDPAWNQVDVDATHITVSRADDDASRRMRSNGNLKLRLKVVETDQPVEVAPPR